MHVIILAKLNRFIDIENYSEDILHKTNNKEKLWRIFPLIYFLFIQMRRYLFLQRNIWAARPAEYRVWSCWWCGWCKSKCQSPPRWTDSFWNKTIQSLFESAGQKYEVTCLPSLKNASANLDNTNLQMTMRNLSSSRARCCCSGSSPSDAFWTHCSSWWRKTCRMLSGRSDSTGGISSSLEIQDGGGKAAQHLCIPKRNAQWFCPVLSSSIYLLLANTG